VVIALCWICLAGLMLLVSLAAGQTEPAHPFRIEAMTGGLPTLRQRFSDTQLEILEKVNRADLEHLPRLPTLVVPEQWVADELAYSVLPAVYASAQGRPKALVVHVPGQIFGAYESGQLVRWGPVSTGARTTPTPEGLFALNWKATGHTSTVNPAWFMRWYFNFGNREGLAFHEYPLTGLPASHGCIRMLPRDAMWLFTWGDEWVRDASGTRLSRAGTPVFIVGSYDFTAQPPWRSADWLAQMVSLPPFPLP
jgi:hypothetical protein